MIFETHAHYDDKAFDTDRDELLGSMKENGIGRIAEVAASMEGCRNALNLCEKNDNMIAVLGVHPEDCANLSEEDMAWIKNQALSNPKVRAIGEIGLDYYWDEPARDIQKKWFIRQLELAKEVNLPIVVHSRDAAADTMEIIKSFSGCDCTPKGVIHCFSYEKEMAKEYIKMGFLIGVGGVVTFKNGRKLKEVVETIPLESIVVETDCPYMAPHPFRGTRNSSLYIPYIIEEIAKIKGVDKSVVEDVTWNNAMKLYGLSE